MRSHPTGHFDFKFLLVQSMHNVHLILHYLKKISAEQIEVAMAAIDMTNHRIP